MLSKLKCSFLLLIVFLQLIVYITIFFNISVIRQVVGFIYFTFVPGLIIVKLLRLNEKLEILEIVLFSVGLSVAFLMIVGLLINHFAYLFSVSNPLSLMPLLIVFNSFILLGAVLASLRGGCDGLSTRKLNFHLFALALFCLPILSIVGAMLVNVSGKNFILLLMIVIITIVFAVGVISNRFFSPKFYPLAIFVIAISLLYHSSLISNYLVVYGSDAAREHYVFQNTRNNMYWDYINPYSGNIQNGRVHSMLSVTILPTVYSNLLGVDSTWVFKALFPLIFSFVPLGLYQLFKSCWSEKEAFASTFLFMACETFYTEMLGLNRQMIAELFFILLLLLILSEKMKGIPRTLCFALFSFGLITSHYGLAEVFLFFIFFTFLFLFMFKYESKTITAEVFVLFFVIMFTWYIYTTNQAVFNSILEYGDYVRDQLQDFLNPASRGTIVLRGLGMESAPTVWNMISRTFAYLTELFIVIGFLDLIVKRRRSLNKEYLLLSTIAMTLLGALIMVPGLANTLNMTRFYHILLFIFSPLCVIGAESICNFIFKRRVKFYSSMLLLIVLIPYFLFQTSFVYEVVGTESWSLPLSKYRTNSLKLYVLFGYVDETSVMGANWLTINIDVRDAKIHADTSSIIVLFGYGMVTPEDVIVLSNVTVMGKNEIVYMNVLNLIDGVIVSSSYILNTTGLTFLHAADVIYSNGKNEIYQNVG